MHRVHGYLRRLALMIALLAALTVCAFAADTTASTPAEFYDVLEQCIRAQKESFSIAYAGDYETLDLPNEQALGLLLRNMSAQSPDDADNADYPSLNISDGQLHREGGAYVFELSYLATPAQIDEVSRRAREIVDSFELEGEDDFTKAKLLYEYIGTHYIYDETLTKFSAYDGLTTGSMVCQGYALLAYKVMWEAGIPCRIITGTSAAQSHAWNIVKLDGKWYNLDSTWDAADEIGGIMQWTYFLKNAEDFVGHTRATPYESAEFQASHPIAKTSFELPKIKLQIAGSDVGVLTIRAGMEVQLEALLSGTKASEIQWVSTSPAVVQVTADGRLTANAVGNTVITAQVVGNRGIISAQLPTYTVDLRMASPWAYEAVTQYYLLQMLPTDLCVNLQDGVTRAELAKLCYQYVKWQSGLVSLVSVNPFQDIYESPESHEIMYCHAIGLMEGTSSTTFSPDQAVTREQAAKVLVKLIEYLDDAHYVSADVQRYRDAEQISGWAVEYVGGATEAGVLQGTGDGFRPQAQMTREQIIAALQRIYIARADGQDNVA